jgi:hypothetical protein
MDEREDTGLYEVMVNAEGQYSLRATGRAKALR